MIQLQRDLTAIPAMSPDFKEGSGEVKKAEFLLNYLKEKGFNLVDHYNVPDDRVAEKMRPNFTVHIKGKDSSRKFWIMVHIDVVPPGNLKKWTGDPWVLRVDGDNLIGRGVEDNQQGVVSAIFALRAFIDLGIQPEYDTFVILVSDEETGSKFGIDYILKNHNLFGKDDLIIVPDAGEPEGAMIEVAEKSILWMEIETTGKQCHASTPHQGINAHRASADLIVMLDELKNKFSLKDPVYDVPQSTFEPTKKLANVGNINTIPGSDVIFYDCRVLSQYEIDDVIAFVREKADIVENKYGVKIEIKFPQIAKAAPPTPVDAPIVKILKVGVKEVYEIEANIMGIGGGTVAAFFRRYGFKAAVWSSILDTCHQPDEVSKISYMIKDTKVFAYAMSQKA
jgi:succinyl-diaminopimelate desuccinylase